MGHSTSTQKTYFILAHDFLQLCLQSKLTSPLLKRLKSNCMVLMIGYFIKGIFQPNLRKRILTLPKGK